jgi:tetratricopeptide (TPR) repeat protein
LRALESSPTPDDRLRIWFLNDLGLAELGVANLDGSRAYLERALEFRERVYPDERDAERINGLNNLAYVLMLQGDTRRARPMLERCVRLGEEVYGPDHAFLANALQGLAEVYRRDGDLADARDVLSRAASIFDKRGLDHTPVILDVLLTRAQIDETEGKLAEAESSLREAIEIVTTSLGHDSPFQIGATDLLVRVMRKSRRFSEADALQRRADDLRAKSGQVTSLPFGASTPQTRID